MFCAQSCNSVFGSTCRKLKLKSKMTDSEQEQEIPKTLTELQPAYETDGAQGELTSRGLHCSSYPDDFCFFCAYERNTDASSNEVDLYSSLTDLASHLSSLNREPAAIAKHIFAEYEASVRQHVDGCPKWTLQAITRHLLYNSGSSTGVFDTAITNMFTSLIARQNASLVDKSTNMVIEDHRKAFVDTVAQYAKWKTLTKKQSKSKTI
jgi:hypothetical protein